MLHSGEPAPDFAAGATPSPSLRALAARGVVRRYAKDTLLIEEGDTGDLLYVLLRGQVRAYSLDAEGREVTYGRYGPGDFVGEMSLDGGPRSASVRVEEAATCARVSRATLEAHIAADPAFAFELIRKVIGNARALTARTKALALEGAYSRLVGLLNAMAVPQPDGTRRVEEPVTHLELSRQLGCGRTMVTRLLGDLARNGAIVVEDRHIRIVRPLPARW